MLIQDLSQMAPDLFKVDLAVFREEGGEARLLGEGFNFVLFQFERLDLPMVDVVRIPWLLLAMFLLLRFLDLVDLLVDLRGGDVCSSITMARSPSALLQTSIDMEGTAPSTGFAIAMMIYWLSMVRRRLP